MPGSAADFSLILVGEPRWRAAGQELPLARLDAALLALLALASEQPRDRVAAWLWPTSSSHNANLSLRQRLFRLRQTLGHPLVEAGTLLRLLPDVRCELQGEGELLGGLDFGDLEAFDAWLTAERSQLLLRRTDAWAGEAAQLEARGALAEAIVLAERVVAQRPALEHGWRRLMRLHYLRGDRSAAIEAFERFEEQVCREQGLRPAAETLALLDTIERAPLASPQAGGPLPAALTRPPQLVGREASLQAMAQAWASGRAVLLIAEGGLGKSRLIEEFLLGHAGALTLRARPGDAGMPYGTLTQLLVQASDRFAPALPAAVQEELARLAPLFGQAPASPARQAVLWMAVETALRSCADHGLTAIALDDLHHADAATLELMHWLLASTALAPLRFIFAARPNDGELPPDTLATWLGNSQRIEPVRLQALDEAGVQALLHTLALPSLPDLGRPLAAALFQHAGGHPFLTLETLKSLAQGNTALPGAMPVPAAAAALIDRSVQKLPSTARELLRLLALGGADLRLDLAAQVLGLPLMELAKAWGDLQAAQLVLPSGTLHDLVRDCVRNALAAPARRVVRFALARALSAQAGVSPLRLAEHWLDCEAWPEAVLSLRAAALLARLSGRLLEYETLLHRACDAAARGGDDAQSFDARCEALSVHMLRCGAEAVLPRVIEQLAHAGGAEQRARLNVIACEAQLNLGQVALALAAGVAALALATPGSAVHFEAVVLHGRALALSGRTAQAITALELELRDAPRFADPTRVMQAQAALAHAHFADGSLARALAAQHRALEIAHTLGDATEVAHNMSNLASIASHAGDVELTLQMSRQAHQRFVAMGMTDGHFAFNCITLARHAAFRGQLHEASAALHAMTTLEASQLGATIHTMGQVAQLGLCLWRGQAHEVQRWCSALAHIDREAVMPLAQVAVFLALLRAGDEGSRAPARSALAALATSHPALRDNVVLYRDWARWESMDTALGQLSQLAKGQRAAGIDPAARGLELAELELMVNAGDAADHTAIAQKALRLAQEVPLGLMAGAYPPQAWWTLARALHLTGHGRDAQACRGHAVAWINAAVLPDDSALAQANFREGNPVNRAVLSAHWAVAGW